jgi:hypothetical protein
MIGPRMNTDNADNTKAESSAWLRVVTPRRDAVDARIAREVHDGAGRIVKWVDEAGGWPEFPGR